MARNSLINFSLFREPGWLIPALVGTAVVGGLVYASRKRKEEEAAALLPASFPVPPPVLPPQQDVPLPPIPAPGPVIVPDIPQGTTTTMYVRAPQGLLVRNSPGDSRIIGRLFYNQSIPVYGFFGEGNARWAAVDVPPAAPGMALETTRGFVRLFDDQGRQTLTVAPNPALSRAQIAQASAMQPL